LKYLDFNFFRGADGTVLLKPSKEFLPKYFFNVLYHCAFDLIENRNKYERHYKYLQNLYIPQPPIDIQKKIVAEIETLEKQGQESIEEIEKKNNEIISNFIELKYEYVSLGNIVSFKNGLNYSRQSLGEVITIVGVGDFKENFSPNLEQLEKIQIEGNLLQDYELKSKDILVVRSNGSARLVGRFLFIDELKDKTSFSGFTIRLRVNSKDIDSKFLCHYLKTDIIRNGLMKDSKGSNIKSLNQTLLSSIKIPLPPIYEQQKIVAAIEKIESKITELEKQIADIPKQKEKILRKYLI